jgi:hypothetical protein
MVRDERYTRADIENMYRRAVRDLDAIEADIESGTGNSKDLLKRLGEVEHVANMLDSVAYTAGAPWAYHPQITDLAGEYCDNLRNDIVYLRKEIEFRGRSSKFVEDAVLYLKLPDHEARQLENAIMTLSPEDAMKRADELLSGYGVESIRDERRWVSHFWQDTALLYVNMGDTYDDTLCYDTYKKEFFVGSWGDFVEEKGIR